MREPRTLRPMGNAIVATGADGKHGSVYDRNRFADWYMVAVKLAVAAWLFAVPAERISIGTEGSWASALNGHQWGAVLIGLAFARGAAVLINGRIPGGGSAIIRLVVATIGAAFWSQVLYYTIGVLAIANLFGLIVFSSWLLLDLASAARAAFDYARIRLGLQLAKAANGHAATSP
jgi:hypothetical protein